jgi:Tudor domain
MISYWIDLKNNNYYLIPSLRLLPDSFINIKRTLLKLYLPLKNVEISSEPGVCVEKLKSFLDMPMELNLYTQHKDCWMGSLSRREVGVEKLMVYHGMAEIISFDVLRSFVDANEPIMCLNTSFDVEKAEFGVMTFAVNPNCFYILLVNNVQKRNALQEKLKFMSSTLPELGTIKVGSICVAPSKSRNFWGRAKIVSSPDPTRILLTFIDFGFTDSIDVNESSLLKMNSEECEPYVRHCSLAVKNTNAFDDMWGEKAIRIIDDLIEKDIFIEVLAKTRKKYYVSMFRHNQNIGNILVSL